MVPAFKGKLLVYFSMWFYEAIVTPAAARAEQERSVDPIIVVP
jgi:hypothetical protein